MSITAGLLLYGLSVMVLGPALLRRVTRSGHVPRLGVAAWLTAIASMLITWAAAAVLLVIDLAGTSHHANFFVAYCLDRLRNVVSGDAGAVPQLLTMAVATPFAVAVVVTSLRIARTLRNLRDRARAHAEAIRVVGRSTGVKDVVVIEADKPAAYCVAGRPPAIVVTTGALAALGDRELAAVLAHERAHLAGHHANIVAALRSLAAAFPKLALMTEGAVEVSRLLEMCADDAAARRHGRAALLSSLVTLAGAAPVGALAAADVAVLSRAERLNAPPADHAKARTRAALASVIAIMVAVPLLAAVSAVAGALMCGA